MPWRGADFFSRGKSERRKDTQQGYNENSKINKPINYDIKKDTENKERTENEILEKNKNKIENYYFKFKLKFK